MILELYPTQHQMIKYQYAVNNVYYKGVSASRFIGIAFGNLKVGQELDVWYLLNKPDISTLGNPVETFKNEQKTVFLTSLLFPIPSSTIKCTT